ncbi:syntaxin of plants 123, partial [Perilla frutescens var. frutescens]
SCFAANAKADISDMKMASQLVRKSSEIGVESFIEQIEQIEEQIEIFSNLLVKLKEASEESKSVTKTPSMTVTGTRPDDEVMNTLEEFDERHDTLKQTEKKLLELHQIYLDMAVLVVAQGDMIDDHIEKKVCFGAFNDVRQF